MNNSPYLDKPFVPLAVALRSMLAETEAKIPGAPPSEKARLQERAEVLREWLTPGDHRPRRDLDRGRRLGSRASVVSGLAGGGVAGAIGPNLATMPRKVWTRGDRG